MVAALLGVFIIYSFLASPKALSTILPGFEGETGALYGYQPSTEAVSSLGNALVTPPGACSYAWVGTPTLTQGSIKVVSPGNGLLGSQCLALTKTDTLQLDAQQNLVTYSSPYTEPIPVSYHVPIPGTTDWKNVTGSVEEYTYNLDISVESGSSGSWTFAGDTIWFNLASLVWNEASQDPYNSSITGPTFEAPLYGVVYINPTWQNQGSSQCSICVTGQSLSFYNAPSAVGQTLVTLSDDQAPTSGLNASLSSQLAPDSRMQQLVYYPVTIDQMKSNCPIGGQCSYPSVQVSILLYTLRIGEYILTNADKTGLGTRTQSCTGLGCVTQALDGIGNWFGGLGSWLSNPLNQVSSFVYILIFAAVMVFIVVTVFMRRIPAI